MEPFCLGRLTGPLYCSGVRSWESSFFKTKPQYCNLVTRGLSFPGRIKQHLSVVFVALNKGCSVLRWAEVGVLLKIRTCPVVSIIVDMNEKAYTICSPRRSARVAAAMTSCHHYAPLQEAYFGSLPVS